MRSLLVLCGRHGHLSSQVSLRTSRLAHRISLRMILALVPQLPPLPLLPFAWRVLYRLPAHAIPCIRLSLHLSAFFSPLKVRALTRQSSGTATPPMISTLGTEYLW